MRDYGIPLAKVANDFLGEKEDEGEEEEEPIIPEGFEEYEK